MKKLETTIRFKGTLLKPLGETAVISLPDEARECYLPSEGEIIEGVLNLFPFRSILEPEGGFRVSPELRKAAGLNFGDEYSAEITRIGDEPEVRVPADLLEGLEAEPAAMAQWLSTTPNARREWVRWYVSCKQEQTRQTHFAKAIDMLSKGKKRICCFPGLNWTTKDYPDVDTWVPLPK